MRVCVCVCAVSTWLILARMRSGNHCIYHMQYGWWYRWAGQNTIIENIDSIEYIQFIFYSSCARLYVVCQAFQFIYYSALFHCNIRTFRNAFRYRIQLNFIKLREVMSCAATCNCIFHKHFFTNIMPHALHAC